MKKTTKWEAHQISRIEINHPKCEMCHEGKHQKIASHELTFRVDLLWVCKAVKFLVCQDHLGQVEKGVEVV